MLDRVSSAALLQVARVAYRFNIVVCARTRGAISGSSGAEETRKACTSSPNTEVP